MADRADGEATGGTAPGGARDRAGRRLRAGGLTAARQAILLDALAETSSVRVAIAAAGGTRRAWYELRERDAAFDAAWRAAQAYGFEALEGYALAAALGREVPPGFDADLALRMLGRRDEQAVRPPGYGRITTVKHVPIAEVEEEIMRRLAAIGGRRRAAGDGKAGPVAGGGDGTGDGTGDGAGDGA